MEKLYSGFFWVGLKVMAKCISLARVERYESIGIPITGIMGMESSCFSKHIRASNKGLLLDQRSYLCFLAA